MLNFENKNEGTWFYVDDKNHDLGGVCLRVLSADELLSIEKITTKTKKKIKRGVAYDDIKTDEALASKMRWRYCIVDWSNLQLNGKEVECNNENKLELCKSLDFLSWVVDCLEELTEKNTVLEEARLGNSSDTSSGNTDQIK